MSELLLSYGIPYGGYFLELALLVFILKRGGWRKWRGISMYLLLLIGVDGISRPLVLYRYGASSPQHTYFYFYWSTDVLLALGAFLLVCSMFRRALAEEPKMWAIVLPALCGVFTLVLGISVISILQNYKNLFSIFILEFQQNLYFACLVLNTLLYILLQRLEHGVDDLSLTVCGLGIQFAGPAANFALVYLTHDRHLSDAVYPYLGPLCTLGMLLTWSYAVFRVPKRAELRTENTVPAWAEGSVLRS